MEGLEDGELSSTEGEEVEEDGEEETSAAMPTAPAEQVDEETCDAVLSTLQQQLESRCACASCVASQLMYRVQCM